VRAREQARLEGMRSPAPKSAQKPDSPGKQSVAHLKAVKDAEKLQAQVSEASSLGRMQSRYGRPHEHSCARTGRDDYKCPLGDVIPKAQSTYRCV
jgi:hypothetical protein